MKVTTKVIEQTCNDWVILQPSEMRVFGEAIVEYTRLNPLFHVMGNECLVEMSTFKEIKLETKNGYLEVVGIIRDDLPSILGDKREVSIHI